jgi:flagellar motor component MotA
MKNTKKPSFWDYIGAAIMGAILGAFLAYGLLNGGF